MKTEMGWEPQAPPAPPWQRLPLPAIIAIFVGIVVAAVSFSGFSTDFKDYESARAIQQEQRQAEVLSSLEADRRILERMHEQYKCWDGNEGVCPHSTGPQGMTAHGIPEPKQMVRDRSWFVRYRDRWETLIERRDYGHGMDKVALESDFTQLAAKAMSGIRLVLDVHQTKSSKDMQKLRANYELIRAGDPKADLELEGQLKSRWAVDGVDYLRDHPAWPHSDTWDSRVLFPLTPLFLLLACCYLFTVPVAGCFLIKFTWERGYSALAQAEAIAIFSLFWFFVPLFNPRKVDSRLKAAFDKQVERLKDLGTQIETSAQGSRAPASCRWAVALGLLMACLPSGLQNRVYAQEAPVIEHEEETSQADQQADKSFLRALPDESAVESDWLGSNVKLSLRNSFLRAASTTTFPRDEDVENNTGFRHAQFRLAVNVGDPEDEIQWTAYTQVHFVPQVTLAQAWLQGSAKVYGLDTKVMLGRFFIPYWSAIPPPFVGALDSPLTDQLPSHFFGDGIKLTVNPLEALSLSATAFKGIVDNGAPNRFAFAASYKFGEWATLTFAGQVGSDLDEDWIVGAEVYGRPWEGWRYEVLGIARKHESGRHDYGLHSFVRYNFTPGWAVLGQFDWVNSEEEDGHDRITRRYKATLGFWYEPARFVRLQVDGGHEWLRGATFNNTWFVTLAATVKFP